MTKPLKIITITLTLVMALGGLGYLGKVMPQGLGYWVLLRLPKL